MVFFTCMNCGDGVKKPSVVKHFETKCRNRKIAITCMDCHKDFDENTFHEHTKCITEAERYSGKDFVPKINTGEKKQNEWLECLKSIELSKEKIPPKIMNSIKKLIDQQNVPRKKTKFENFAVNSLRIKKPEATAIWNVLEKHLEKFKNKKQENKSNTNTKLTDTPETEKMYKTKNDDSNKNGNVKDNTTINDSLLTNKENDDDNNKSKTKSKKNKHINGSESNKNNKNEQNNDNRKRQIKENDHQDENNLKTKKLKYNNENNEEISVYEVKPNENGTCSDEKIFDAEKVNLKELILKNLEKHPNGIALDKLKKKVQKKYLKIKTIDEEKFNKKFKTKLNKIESIVIDSEIVKIK